MNFSDMKKFFPLSVKMGVDSVKTLFILIGGYYLAAVLGHEILRLFQLNPVIGGVFKVVEGVLKIYCFIGIGIALYEYLKQQK